MPPSWIYLARVSAVEATQQKKEEKHQLGHSVYRCVGLKPCKDFQEIESNKVHMTGFHVSIR